jgi:hypothetical protein
VASPKSDSSPLASPAKDFQFPVDKFDDNQNSTGVSPKKAPSEGDADYLPSVNLDSKAETSWSYPDESFEKSDLDIPEEDIEVNTNDSASPVVERMSSSIVADSNEADEYNFDEDDSNRPKSPVLSSSTPSTSPLPAAPTHSGPRPDPTVAEEEQHAAAFRAFRDVAAVIIEEIDLTDVASSFANGDFAAQVVADDRFIADVSDKHDISLTLIDMRCHPDLIIDQINEIIDDLRSALSDSGSKSSNVMALRFLCSSTDLSNISSLRRLIKFRFDAIHSEAVAHATNKAGITSNSRVRARALAAAAPVLQSVRDEEARVLAKVCDELTSGIMDSWLNSFLSETVRV